MDGYYCPPDAIYAGYYPPVYGGVRPWLHQFQAPANNMTVHVHPEGRPTFQASSEDESDAQASST